MHQENDPKNLPQLRETGQRLADEKKEPVLLMTINDPKRAFVEGYPYCVLLSQADTFERANAYQMFKPGGVAISGVVNVTMPEM